MQPRGIKACAQHPYRAALGHPGGALKAPFPRQAGGKSHREPSQRALQLQGSLGRLAMAFSPCLSRERRFQGSPRMPKSGPVRMLGAGFDPSRLHFPPPCRRNIQVRAP